MSEISRAHFLYSILSVNEISHRKSTERIFLAYSVGFLFSLWDGFILKTGIFSNASKKMYLFLIKSLT